MMEELPKRYWWSVNESRTLRRPRALWIGGNRRYIWT